MLRTRQLALLAGLLVVIAGCPTGKTVARGDGQPSMFDSGDAATPPHDLGSESAARDLAADASHDGADDATDASAFTSIVLVALDNAITGNLGGVAGADALCAQAASNAGSAGTYRAFLSSSTQDARDLVAPAKRALPVLDTRGVMLFSSWNEIFTRNEWRDNARIDTFNGTLIEDSGPWFDSDAWTGTRRDGTLASGHTCNDWTSAASNDNGTAGELDLRQLLDQDHDDCSRTLALVCVRLP
ncbi:MAG: DUF1554 domain-containing protein [Myxococcales bacterium]|nr:DUF1554 domain-containing protein [Myxococcales bacterium]